MTGKKPKRKLPTGTPNTTTKGGLSAADICRIIKLCNKNSVTSITVDGLSISFAPKRTLGLHNKPEVTPVVETTSDAPSGSSNVQESEVTSVATQLDAELELEAELDALAIEDPSAYEALMIDDQLNGGRGLAATYEATRNS